MGVLVASGAMMTCSFGVAPAALAVIPKTMVTAGPPLATIMDFAPAVNIPPFGMCTTLSNPTVASATSAAMGVLTPMPCVPATAAPWAPGAPTVMIGTFPALTKDSVCMCSYGGVISITVPGQFTAQSA